MLIFYGSVSAFFLLFVVVFCFNFWSLFWSWPQTGWPFFTVFTLCYCSEWTDLCPCVPCVHFLLCRQLLKRKVIAVFLEFLPSLLGLFRFDFSSSLCSFIALVHGDHLYRRRKHDSPLLRREGLALRISLQLAACLWCSGGWESVLCPAELVSVCQTRSLSTSRLGNCAFL